MEEFTNSKVAGMLREVAAALTIKKANLFQIRAYETAADNIEKSSVEIQDLWAEGKLDQVPGIGPNLQEHLNELFKTGKVKHWEEVKQSIPKQVFSFLDIPGVGPKTALELAELGVKDIEDLASQIKTGELVNKGFSAKIAEKIMAGVEELSSIKSGRILLPYAFAQAERVLDYLKESPSILKANALGSLRRMVATIGDLDFSIASKEPVKAVEHIINMPGISRVVDKGETKVTIALNSGLQLDFLIVEPNVYGALLQHFTGSKSHNIHLRSYAQSIGLSLSEFGVKNIKTDKTQETSTEEEFYGLLGMDVPPPELREDTGEIEAALEHKLPKLVELKDIKGDLHVHSSFHLEPSHGPGANSIKEIAEAALRMGYSYIGIADHSPSFTNHTPEQIVDLIKKRTEAIEQINYSNKDIRVLNLLEVDILPDGSLSVPDEGLKLLDFALAGIHSSHRMPKEEMTKRIIKALSNPYVKVLTHPTGRILNERSGFEADWPEIFKLVAKNNQALEINAYPNRLDLSDNLIREAKKLGVKFIINTDSHEISQMSNMVFGVATARRGWATKEDIVNCLNVVDFKKWYTRLR